MEFTYLTARIKEICEKRALAVAELGEEAAMELERRLADIDACDNALELRALWDDDVLEINGHRWALPLADGRRVELVAGHVKPTLTETGATDWGKVVRVRIETIEVGNG